MPLSPKKPDRDPGTLLAWQILAPIAGLFIVLLLAAGLAARNHFEPAARFYDLGRAQSQAEIVAQAVGYKYELSGRTGLTPPKQLADELGFPFLARARYLPPGQTPPWKSPRFAPSGRDVEGWTKISDRQGNPLGTAVMQVPAARTIFVREAVKSFALAACATFALAILLAWVLLKYRVSNRLAEIQREVDPPHSRDGGRADAIALLHDAVRETLAKNRSTETRLRERLDGHSEMVCISTPEGTILRANAAYARAVGSSPEKLAGKSYLDLIPPPDRAEALSSVLKLSREQPESHCEHRLIMPDGSTRWTRWRDTGVFDNTGKLTHALSFGTDITREKQAVEEAASLNLAFEQMQSLALTGSLRWNFKEDLMEWTRETFQLLGLDSAATVPTLDRLIESVAPDERETVRQLFLHAIQDGSNFQHTFSVILPGGSQRTLLTRAEVSADPKTKLLDKLTCTLQDITALREAENAVRRELRYREAIEGGVSVGIVVRDMAGRALSANPAFTAMVGFSEQELIDAVPPCEPYWPDEYRPAIEKAMTEVLEGRGAPGGYELVFCRKNGERFDVLVNVAPLTDENNRQTGWLGAVTDITSIQQTRRELREAEASLRRELLYRQALDKSVTVALINIGMDGRPLEVNEAYCRMFGYSHAEVMAMKPPYPLWPESERENIAKAFAQHLAGETPPEGFSLRFQHKDGRLLDVLITAAAVRGIEGKQIGILSAITDVTGLQSAQRDLRMANERLSAALDGLRFGTFQHDFGVGALNWSEENYALHGIDPSVTDPAKLFAAWKDAVGGDYPGIERMVASLPPKKTHLTYDYGVQMHPSGEKQRIRSSVFIERDKQGHPTRLVGITRRID